MMFDSPLMSGLGPRFWYQLSCFAYVVHFKSYSKAADCLHLSQSSLSRAIQSLEGQLKVSLLYRGGKRALCLTPQGDQLYAHGAEIFKGLLRLEQCLEPSVKTKPYTLQLAVPDWVFSDYLFIPLRQFRKEHPGFSLGFHPSTDLAIFEGSTDPTIRLGIPSSSGLIQKLLLELQLALYANATYLKGHMLPERLGDLAEHACLGLQTDNPKLFEVMNWHQAHNPSTDQKHYSSTALIKVAQMGFGMMSWVKGSPALEGSGLVEIAKELSVAHAPRISLYFECVPEQWACAEVQALYRCLKKALQGYYAKSA